MGSRGQETATRPKQQTPKRRHCVILSTRGPQGNHQNRGCRQGVGLDWEGAGGDFRGAWTCSVPYRGFGYAWHTCPNSLNCISLCMTFDLNSDFVEDAEKRKTEWNRRCRSRSPERWSQGGHVEARGACVLVVSEDLPVCKTMSRSVLIADNTSLATTWSGLWGPPGVHAGLPWWLRQ